MILAGRKSQLYSLGCRVRGSHPVYSSYKRISYPRTEREVSPTPVLYNSAKLCQPFRYLECKRNKLYYDEGGGGGHLQKRKVRFACLDGDEIEGKGKVSWSEVNAIFTGVHEMERAREGWASC